MEEAYPWKKHIEDEVAWVGDCFYRARNLVPPHLETTWVIGTSDAESTADLIALAEKQLGDASTSLVAAVVGMEAVVLVALRSGGYNPAAPLPSIDSALLSLQKARALAEKAIGAIVRCRGHLGAATLLLGHPAVHGADDCIDAERASAVSALEVAQQKVEEIEALVGAACEVLGATAPPDPESEDV